jgi:hypothetical protein
MAGHWDVGIHLHRQATLHSHIAYDMHNKTMQIYFNIY